MTVTLHQPFSIHPPSACIADLDEKLRHQERLTDEWRKYWDSYHENRGIPRGHFLRESREWLVFMSQCDSDVGMWDTVITASCSALYADFTECSGISNDPLGCMRTRGSYIA
jgi:hypothetical protein